MAIAGSAGRVRRPSWRDPRLGVGVLLVAGSVALGTWAIGQADRTIEVYSAREALSPGAAMTEEDLAVVRVQIRDVQDLYLTPQTDLTEGTVVVRTVGAGELVPRSSVGQAADLAVRPVAVPAGRTALTYLSAGARVDMWVARPDGAGPTASLLAPELLVADVEIAAVHEDTSLFAGSDQIQVQVLLTENDLPEVLAALSSAAEITLVPQLGGTQ